MIRSMPDFNDERDKKVEPQSLLPNQLYEEMANDGLPDGFTLTESAKEFLAGEGDERERIFRQSYAEGQIPFVEKRLDQLVVKHERVEKEVDRFALRRRIPKINWEVVGTLTMIPFAMIVVILSAAAGCTFNFEFDFARAAILEGSLFETPAADPRLPAIEPSFGVVMGMALAPIFGLFVVLEFISLVSKEKNASLFTKILAIVALPLTLTTTWMFAWIVGGGMSEESAVGLAFQTQSPPWYYFGLTITTTSLINAILFYGITWVFLQCFEFEPRNKQFCEGLENTGNRLIERIRDTVETLTIFYGCGKVEESTQRFEKLRSEMNLWSFNRRTGAQS